MKYDFKYTSNLYFCKTHSEAIAPSYESTEAACMDIATYLSVHLMPGETSVVPTGLIMVPPKGYHLHLYLRSSTPMVHKYPGLVLANHVGIIDSDYVGKADEIKAILRNDGDKAIMIPAGKPFLQMRLVRNIKPSRIKEISLDSLTRKTRGGLGSTDKKA